MLKDTFSKMFGKVHQIIWTACRSPYVYISVLLTLALFYLLDISQLDMYSIKIKSDMKINLDNGFLIKTTGCRIPFLDPYDKSILKYVFKVKPFNCSNVPPLVSSNLTSLYVEHEHLQLYNISNLTMLDCCYTPFWRVDPAKNEADTLYRYGDCKHFESSVTVEDEFVKVECKVNDAEIYKDFHSFVPIKKDSSNQTQIDKINVLVVGLDSISRLNFQRQLPKTRTFLQDSLNAIELIGYNKVGDNTFPNLIPILTGQSVDELTQICWNTTQTKFDDCPFIWNNFSKAGYLTSYAEDASWMGVFNYVKRGFKKQPTDYYWRTFNYLAEKEIGHNRPYNADLCMGTRPVYTVLLDYILKFATSLKNEAYFGFFWGASLSHDNLNYPAQGDENYLKFFKELSESNLLNRSVLIVLSDHGMRWGSIRSTHQGHLEERLPFLFVAVPPWFNKIYPAATANLRRNSRRLTTPFDLHETLVDLLNIQQLSSDNIKLRTLASSNNRGISLFLSIPENRTCSSANISSHWCTCQESVEIEKNNSMIVKGAEFMIKHMNLLLVGYKSCSWLHLDKVIDARLLTSDDYLKNNSTIHDYTIIVKAEPGGGLFEGTVRCVSCDKEEPFQMTGTISRLNLYGNQSACITDYHLKLYCYCGH